MPKFLVIEDEVTINRIMEDMFLINGKNEKHVREKIDKDWTKYLPYMAKSIKEMITRTNDHFLSDFICRRCEHCDPNQGTCFHKCVKDEEFIEESEELFFVDNTQLLVIYREVRSGNTRRIQKLMDFLYESKKPNFNIIPFEKIRSYR